MKSAHKSQTAFFLFSAINIIAEKDTVIHSHSNSTGIYPEILGRVNFIQQANRIFHGRPASRKGTNLPENPTTQKREETQKKTVDCLP